jgi:hypothetical protein
MPPAEKRSSCHRMRSLVTSAPLHHHSEVGPNVGGGSAKSLRSSGLGTATPPDLDMGDGRRGGDVPPRRRQGGEEAQAPSAYTLSISLAASTELIFPASSFCRTSKCVCWTLAFGHSWSMNGSDLPSLRYFTAVSSAGSCL